MDQTTIAIAIFLAAYAIIISEKIHRTVIAMFGAMMMIMLGILDQETAIHHIDFNTLGLLIGMMSIVNVTAETGLFNYLAIWAAQAVKADPKKLLLALATLTAVCSALLDNVTTVLLTVPVTFSITKKLNVPVIPFLMAQIVASNIGGTATLVGDPPNIMIGSAVGLSFMDFIYNMTLPAIVIFLVTIFLMEILYGRGLHTTEELKKQVMDMDPKAELKDTGLLKKCLAVLTFTLILFILHSELHLESATAALMGASLLLLVTFNHDHDKLEHVFAKVEWLAIFFFAGLFILVGGLVEQGVIKQLAVEAMKLTEGSVENTAILIIWMSAIASAFVDNIPFVATMIPLIQDMGALGLDNLEPMWWSLALGACLGGNGTLIGASANVVVASMAAKEGQPISFLGFMKVAFPLMILSIIISTAYIYLFLL